MLRVGVMLTRSMSQQWAAALIRAMQQSSFASVSAVVWLPPAEPLRASMFSPARPSRALFARYERWDEARHASLKSALGAADLVTLLAGVPALTLSREGDEGASVAALRALHLDLLLSLDVSGQHWLLRGGTRHGTWLLDRGGTLLDPAQPPVWREYSLHADHVVSRLLHFPAPVSGARLVYETRTAVDPSSLALSRSPLYWKSVQIVLRCLRALDEGGQAYLDALPPVEVNDVPSGSSRPAGLGMRSFVRHELWRRVQVRRRSAQRATFAKWCIGVRPRELSRAFDSPAGYRLIIAPRDRFYADPFLFEHDGETWLFFEDFRYDEGKAVISCCRINEAGEPGEPSEVLRLPYHLSYPFLFQEGDQIYMMPESRGNRTVSLFRATRFPFDWEHETDLFSGKDMVDATLHRAGDGTWWMFAGVSDGNYSNSDELCLYIADALKGPWTAHPQNPLLSDVRRARPAGRIFCEGGRLIRPSQDCGPAYGYGLVFSEIEELTRNGYRERPISRLLPESTPGNTGNHTYTRTSKYETIDRFFIESQLSATDIFSPPPPSP